MDRGPRRGEGRPLSAPDGPDGPHAEGERPFDALPAGLVGHAARLARVAALALGFDHAAVLLPDGRTTEEQPRPAAALELDRRVLASGEAVVLERTEDGTLGAYVGLPVSYEDRVVSVLSVCDELPRPVSRRDVSVLLELADLWSVALRQALDDGAAEADPLAVDLARGLQHGEVVPWYQPVVDLVTREVVGVEALARWRRAPGVVEPPSVFVPVAERSDLILDVDVAVMSGALADLATWQTRRPGFWASANLSSGHLTRPGWVERLHGATAGAGVDPSTVILELTETTAPSDPAASRATVDAMRGLGYHVWFDDFGSGWSWLSDLGRFPVDGIKIDRAYADQLGTRTGDVVVRALVSAATELGLSVTIEGIETPSQYERARNLGCHFGQGYLWSRPVPPAAIARWV